MYGFLNPHSDYVIIRSSKIYQPLPLLFGTPTFYAQKSTKSTPNPEPLKFFAVYRKRIGLGIT